jgi:DNA-binding IclR family transcriptional regulator
MGKLFLAHMPKRTREQVYAAGPLTRYTERTVTDPAVLEREVERIRAAGVSVNDQEYMAGLVGMAVPIPDAARPDRFTAALAVHAPDARFDAAGIRSHLPALRDAAARLSVLFAETA